MKLLGIDYGRRRIGVAVTDETGTVIRGRPTIDQKKITDPIAKLLELINHEAPQTIVFGVPLGPHDEETEMSREIRNFAQNLKIRLNNNITIHFIDESFSSNKAQHQLLIHKKKKRRNKDFINMFAACNILEAFQRLQL